MGARRSTKTSVHRILNSLLFCPPAARDCCVQSDHPVSAQAAFIGMDILRHQPKTPGVFPAVGVVPARAGLAAVLGHKFHDRGQPLSPVGIQLPLMGGTVQSPSPVISRIFSQPSV